MKWVRYVVIASAAVAIGVSAWILAIMVLPPSVLYFGKVKQVEKYVAQLEAYKKEHGEYPDERQQKIVPRQEQDNPYFYEGGKSAYRVGFRIGFDEVYYFDSGSKKWSFEDDSQSKSKRSSR